jgi:hypothetical protein
METDRHRDESEHNRLGSPLSNTNNASPVALAANSEVKNDPWVEHQGLIQALSAASERKNSLKKHEESSTTIL